MFKNRVRGFFAWLLIGLLLLGTIAPSDIVLAEGEVTVTFDANGGTIGGTSDAQTESQISVGSPYGTLPTASRVEEGKTFQFLGWYTSQEGWEKVTSETVCTGQTRVYAHWLSSEKASSIAAVTNVVISPDSVNQKYNISWTAAPFGDVRGYQIVGVDHDTVRKVIGYTTGTSFEDSKKEHYEKYEIYPYTISDKAVVCRSYAEAYPTIDAPSNFVATQWGYDLYLNWASLSGADSYVIEGRGTKGSKTILTTIGKVDGVLATEYIDRLGGSDSPIWRSSGPYDGTYYIHAVMGAGTDAKGVAYPEGEISKTVSVSGSWQTGIGFHAGGRITIAVADGYYTGSAVTPKVTVTEMTGITVTADDYTLEYSNNIEKGNNTASVKVSGKKGTRFFDSRVVNFSILESRDITYDATAGAFLINDLEDLKTFKNIASGTSKRGAGYNAFDTDGNPYAGEISAIKGKLTANINLGSEVLEFLESDKAATLDLNNKTITANGDYAIKIMGLDLTVKNGKYAKSGGDAGVFWLGNNGTLKLDSVEINAGSSGYSGSAAIWHDSGNLELSNSKIKNVYGEGIYINKGSNLAVKNNSEIDSYNASIFNYSANVTIKNSTIKSQKNRAVFSNAKENVEINIDSSFLHGFYGNDNSTVVATSSICGALYIYTKDSLVAKDSTIKGFNNGIWTCGNMNVRGCTIIAQRGIFTMDTSEPTEGNTSQANPEYSVGVIFAGRTGRTISFTDTKIEANTITISHIRGFAIMSCPDATMGFWLKAKNPSAVSVASFLADGQQYYAKNIKAGDTYVNGSVYINNGDAPGETQYGYVEYYLNNGEELKAEDTTTFKCQYEVDADGYVEIPALEDADDNIFKGWYLDENFSIPAPSEIPVTSKGGTAVKSVAAGAGEKKAYIKTNYAEYNALYAKWEEKEKLTPSAACFVCDVKDATYDGKQKTASVKIKTGVAGLGSFTVKYALQGSAASTATANAPKDAGKYEVYVDVSAGSKYSAALVKVGSFTIKQADNKITVSSNIERVASKNNQSFQLTAKATGGKLTYASDNKSITINATGKITVAKNYIGKATITVTAGDSNYKTVSQKVTVVVNPVAAAIKKVSSAKSKTITVTWAKVSGITGYEIQYSTIKTFTAKTTKTLTIKSASTSSKVISKLAGKKKYYIRIRTYKTVGKTKFCSKWSVTKTVTTKK